MMRMVGFSLLCAAAFAAPAVQARDCDVTRYGAKANDEVADTKAIQAAIDDCTTTGGRVVLPSGKFVSGTIFLKSNVEFHVGHAALLLGSPRLSDYAPSKEPAGSHTEGKRDGLLIAEKVTNVSITGFGTIDGNGEGFWDPGFLASGKSRPSLPRPMPWIEFRDSRFITVLDTTFQNSPSYGVAFTRSQDVHVRNVKIYNDLRSPNTDGIQVNDTQRVSISGVHISTGDDAIVLKSDNADVEDVVVSDSVLTSDDTAFKYGTSSAKAIRRVTLRDSTLLNSRIGVGLFMRRGGVYEDLSIRNVRYTGKQYRGPTDWPIYIDVDKRGPEFGYGTVRDIRIEGMRIESGGNVLIAGNPTKVLEGIVLRDIEFKTTKPYDLAKVNKPRGNVAFSAIAGSVDYAPDNAFFTLSHVRGLVMERVRVVGATADVGQRQALLLRDVKHAHIAHLDIAERVNASGAAAVSVISGSDIVLAASRVGAANAHEPLVETKGTERDAVLVCRFATSECAASAAAGSPR